MRSLAFALTCAVSFCWSALAVAQSPVPAAPDCAAQAVEKKLAGAALNSFMKKCERDAATAGCEAAAAEKKLSGAARASFTRKCVKDATPQPAEK
ncbi:MAG: hypothetical protein ACR652_15710 [Methylocystis sp.]|uniref:hypothetical protein n=1 Tax=Methylocystis sp. TaxID=1911079 RepID=UPI003DA586CD